MDLKQIKSLLNLISESDVNEVYIEEGDFKIKIKKQSDTIQHVSAAQPQYISQPQTVEVAARPAASIAPASSPAPETPAPTPKSSGATIKSPIVGTYYGAPSPDAKPFIAVGDVVAKGDPLCIIEAMKIMNEINAEVSGKITKILVSNGQPVEYDQPLFEIDPS
jgi:acetyl-CoA carboxylase biotin carboxyl carrier protein